MLGLKFNHVNKSGPWYYKVAGFVLSGMDTNTSYIRIYNSPGQDEHKLWYQNQLNISLLGFVLYNRKMVTSSNDMLVWKHITNSLVNTLGQQKVIS